MTELLEGWGGHGPAPPAFEKKKNASVYINKKEFQLWPFNLYLTR